MPPRQVLVRCIVINGRGEASTRYIPASEFGLWQYVMVNRHQIEVARAAVGLWVADAEYRRNDQLFSHTQGETPGLSLVDRVDLSLYDETLGICHLVRRFAASNDTRQLLGRLTARLADSQTQHEISPGHFVGAKEVPDLRRLARPITTLTDGLARAVVALAQPAALVQPTAG